MPRRRKSLYRDRDQHKASLNDAQNIEADIQRIL